MSALHVMWSQPWQPFTDFLLMDEIRIQHSDRKLTRCYECRDLRWAKKLREVLVYFEEEAISAYPSEFVNEIVAAEFAERVRFVLSDMRKGSI